MFPLNRRTGGWVIWGKDGGDGCGVTFPLPVEHRSPSPKVPGVAAPKDGQEERQELRLCRHFVAVINICIVDAKESRLPSIMWVGLTQSVEGPKSKD